MQRHHIFTCGKFKNIWLCYEGFFSKWHLYETHSPAVTFSPWTMCKWSREKQKKESSSSAFLCWVEREGEGGTNEEKAAAWDKEGGEGEKDEYELLFFRRRGIRRWFFLSSETFPGKGRKMLRENVLESGKCIKFSEPALRKPCGTIDKK